MNRHLRDEELLGPHGPTQGAHLRACPSCSKRRSNQEQIQAALRDLDREATPPAAAKALLDAAAVARPVRTADRRHHELRWLAVAAAMLAVGILATVWVVRHPRSPLPPPVIDELALDHLHYEHKVDAAAVKGDEARVSSWFATKLGFSPHLGPLEAVTIEGAKPCRIAGKWTALVWLDRAGHWLSLFTMPEQAADGHGCATAEGVRVCASPDPRGGAGVLVGDLPEPEMMRLVAESLQ